MSKPKEYKRGNAVIVGEKIENNSMQFKTDGVVIYDSYCLSSGTPYLLQSKGSFNAGETIYICGHGNKEKQTISGYTMKEIAEMLCKNYNYTGVEEIKIMSCFSQYKNLSNKDMADLLKDELVRMLGSNTIKVEAICEYESIVVDFFGKALVLDKNDSLRNWCKQNFVQKMEKCNNLVLTDKNYQNELDNYFKEEFMLEIAKWNYSKL